MVPGLFLLAVGDGEGPVVERVRALGVAVRAAHPALDGRGAYTYADSKEGNDIFLFKKPIMIWYFKTRFGF